MKLITHNSQLTANSGRSMVEMLGVLAIMGVITIAAAQMIRVAMQTVARNSIQDEVNGIVTGIRDKYGAYDDFSSIDSRTVFADIGKSAQGKYGIMANPANPRQFIVSLNNLNTNDCLNFIGKPWLDSVGYIQSGGKQSGATAIPSNCNDTNGKNTVQIIYSDN